MRFLVSILLSFFFFIAPLQSSVPEEQSMPRIEHKLSTTTLIGYSISDDHSEALRRLDHRNSSVTHYRVFPFTHFANSFFLKSGIELIQNGKYFIHPYSYCKRFGLKLLFPEHYFWWFYAPSHIFILINGSFLRLFEPVLSIYHQF